MTNDERQALVDEMETLRRLVAQLLVGGPTATALAAARRLVARIERLEREVSA